MTSTNARTATTAALAALAIGGGFAMHAVTSPSPTPIVQNAPVSAPGGPQGVSGYPPGSLPDPRLSPGSLPDPRLSPGVADPRFTLKDVCTPGFTATVRNVPQGEKDAVYAEYGIKTRKPGEYEIDHLISLELGGSNDIKNLWPQSYKTSPYNAHVKDRYENWLHSQLCAGKITLADAQNWISHDWIAHSHQDLGSP